MKYVYAVYDEQSKGLAAFMHIEDAKPAASEAME